MKIFLILLAFSVFMQQGVFATGGVCIEGNCLEGKGVYVWEDGGRYSGDWKNSKRHGQGTQTWPSGTIKSGRWEEDTFVNTAAPAPSPQRIQVVLSFQFRVLDMTSAPTTRMV